MIDESELVLLQEEAMRVNAASLVLKLRGLGIADRNVLRAMEIVPRALFVPKPWRKHAYADRALPIDCGQTISPPSVVGLMIAALDVSDRHSVLEIGTGSGYQAAILAHLARRVTTIERFRTLVRAAERRWVGLSLRTISAVVADGIQGWSRQAPFDRILVTAASETPPVKLITQLTESGILVAPIGPADGEQRLTLFQRIGHKFDTRDIGSARFLPLVPGVAQNL
jgi:protein-L-isoaspartate(D-aspartate) O-methyltransferase